MKVPQITLYAKSTGLEIGIFEKKSDGKPREGRISLRFFSMESALSQIRFVAEPWEGYELYRRITKVFTDGGKESLTHKFVGSAGEVVTKLTVETFERHGKPGYAISIQRGGEGINVPQTADHFLYAAEFLRHLSLVQAWVEPPA